MLIRKLNNPTLSQVKYNIQAQAILIILVPNIRSQANHVITPSPIGLKTNLAKLDINQLVIDEGYSSKEQAIIAYGKNKQNDQPMN